MLGDSEIFTGLRLQRGAQPLVGQLDLKQCGPLSTEWTFHRAAELAERGLMHSASHVIGERLRSLSPAEEAKDRVACVFVHKEDLVPHR